MLSKKSAQTRVITETTQILELLYHDIGEKMKWENSATNFQLIFIENYVYLCYNKMC